MEIHQFGGDWTRQKLEAVERYLDSYCKIFSSGPASHYKTVYVDAFAGTGSILPSASSAQEDREAEEFIKGSARVALEAHPGFNEYIFIEKSPEKAKELNLLRTDFPKRTIKVIQRDANVAICEMCADTRYWRDHRAVMFLDPYGMQVNWETIQAIAATKAIDLWLLFPLGQAVMRLLTKNEMPPQYWQDALTRIFGTDAWKSAFYSKIEYTDLFGESGELTHKTATFKSIIDFFQSRLESIFVGVANNPKPLANSTGNPIYLLCFAVANERGAPIAKRIAQHILKII